MKSIEISNKFGGYPDEMTPGSQGKSSSDMQ